MWFRFLPTKLEATFRAQLMPGRDYAEYLTESDWRHLQSHGIPQEVSTIIQLLSLANKALDTGEPRQAFVEVAAALELAVGKRLKSQNPEIASAIQSFIVRETHKAQAAVTLLLDGYPDDAIEDSLKAISVRNQVVHEGYMPTTDECTLLRRVIGTIGKFTNAGEIKSPVLTDENSLSSPGGPFIRFGQPDGA